ncbi:MAG: hypothetical protein ACOC16_02165 [Nanoarchaeota archaeon]
MVKKIITLLLISSLIIFVGCSQDLNLDNNNNSNIDNNNQTDDNSDNNENNQDLKLACENNNGKWIEDFQECEGISENICLELGGNYNSCASACRHDPDAQMCTKQCVFVCSFNN